MGGDAARCAHDQTGTTLWAVTAQLGGGDRAHFAAGEQAGQAVAACFMNDHHRHKLTTPMERTVGMWTPARLLTRRTERG